MSRPFPAMIMEHLPGEGVYPPLPLIQVDTAAVGAVAHAGGVLLTRTAYATGLSGALSEALVPWRKPLAVHDPAKVLTDLAISLVLGGDALCDAALLRAEPGLYGLVGSEATISRTITSLAQDADKALKAIAKARAAARVVAWDLAGESSPGHGACADDPLVVDLDATLVTAHSDKEHAEPTFKKGTGSTRCAPSLTTALMAPGNPWPCGYARATPGRTRRPITSA